MDWCISLKMSVLSSFFKSVHSVHFFFIFKDSIGVWDMLLVCYVEVKFYNRCDTGIQVYAATGGKQPRTVIPSASRAGYEYYCGILLIAIIT